MTMTEFLTARYDEEEAVARLDRFAIAFVPDGETYRWDDESCVVYVSAVHLLADIAAKRAIVALHQAAERAGNDQQVWLLDEVLKIQVQPYAEHPDFDRAWA